METTIYRYITFVYHAWLDLVGGNHLQEWEHWAITFTWWKGRGSGFTTRRSGVYNGCNRYIHLYTLSTVQRGNTNQQTYLGDPWGLLPASLLIKTWSFANPHNLCKRRGTQTWIYEFYGQWWETPASQPIGSPFWVQLAGPKIESGITRRNLVESNNMSLAARGSFTGSSLNLQGYLDATNHVSNSNQLSFCTGLFNIR